MLGGMLSPLSYHEGGTDRSATFARPLLRWSWQSLLDLNVPQLLCGLTIAPHVLSVLGCLKLSIALLQDLAAAMVVQLPLAQRQASQAAVTKVQVHPSALAACHAMTVSFSDILSPLYAAVLHHRPALIAQC